MLKEGFCHVAALSSVILCNKRTSKAQLFSQEKVLSPVLLSILVQHLQKGDLNSQQVLFPYGYVMLPP